MTDLCLRRLQCSICISLVFFRSLNIARQNGNFVCKFFQTGFRVGLFLRFVGQGFLVLGQCLRCFFRSILILFEFLLFALDVGLVVDDLGLHERQRLLSAGHRFSCDWITLQLGGHRPFVRFPKFRRWAAERHDLLAIGANPQSRNRRSVVDLLLYLTVADIENDRLAVGATGQYCFATRQYRQCRDLAPCLPFIQDPAGVDRSPSPDHAIGMRRNELPVVQPGNSARVQRRRLAGGTLAGRCFPGTHPAIVEQHSDFFSVWRQSQLPGGLALNLVVPKRQGALKVDCLHTPCRAGSHHARLTKRDTDRRDRLATGEQVEKFIG